MKPLLTLAIAFLALISPLAIAAAAPVQDEESAESAPPQTDPPATEDAEQETATDDADVADEEPTSPETFDPLYEEFGALVHDIREAGGHPQVKSLEVDALRTRVAQFNDERTPTELSVAVELQLSEWSRQPGAIDEIYTHLEDVEITYPGLRVKYADYLITQKFRYEEGLEVLERGEIDPLKFPSAAVVRARALAATNRFDEAQAALDSIPPDAPVKPELLDEMHDVRYNSIERLGEGWETEQARLDAERQADDLPRVEFTTTRGAFVIELFENQTPNAVANLINLVEGGFYDGLAFHQVSANFQVMTGDPTTREGSVLTEGSDGLGYRIRDEIPEDARKLWTGYVSMVNTAGPDTAGSQFRIALRRLSHLDETVTVIGRVVDGMRVVRNIEREDRILKAEVLRKRDHPYEVERIRDSDPAETPAEAPSGEENVDDAGAGEADTEAGGGGDDGADDGGS